MVIFNKLLAKLLFWTAQGVMMVGRLGQQAAHQLLTLSTRTMWPFKSTWEWR